MVTGLQNCINEIAEIFDILFLMYWVWNRRLSKPFVPSSGLFYSYQMYEKVGRKTLRD